MTLQMTIIGLGQIGASFGLALQPYSEKMSRVGHDKSRITANRAKKQGAVDRVAITLSGSVKDADIVLLALPMQEIKSVLEHIGEDLNPETLVIDTAPLKAPVLRWAEEFLPDDVYYVGLTPVINPAYLEDLTFGLEAAREDMFQGCLLAVVAGRGTDQKAVKMTTDLIDLVGGDPFFVDPAEIDGVMTMTHIMPRLLATSLLAASLDRPGWREGQKMAGKAYSTVTSPMAVDDVPGALANMAVNNQDNMVRVINDLIRILIDVREDVESGAEERLAEKFLSAQKGRDLWRQDRESGKWSDHQASEEIERGGLLGDLFGFRPPRPPAEDEDE